MESMLFNRFILILQVNLQHYLGIFYHVTT